LTQTGAVPLSEQPTPGAVQPLTGGQQGWPSAPQPPQEPLLHVAAFHVQVLPLARQAPQLPLPQVPPVAQLPPLATQSWFTQQPPDAHPLPRQQGAVEFPQATQVPP
jgi:hypothetical protein